MEKDTLNETFAKIFHCKHGKELGQYCEECRKESREQSRKNRKATEERLRWADFHDNVLNS